MSKSGQVEEYLGILLNKVVKGFIKTWHFYKNSQCQAMTFKLDQIKENQNV
jgi:hypothetical protein